MDDLRSGPRDPRHVVVSPTHRAVVAGLVIAATLCLGVWTLVLRSMWHQPLPPQPAAPPSEPQISVSGYADQHLTSDRVEFSLSLCTEHGAGKLVRPAKALLAFGKQRLGADAIQQTERPDDLSPNNDGDSVCRNFAVRTTKVAAALAWRHEVLGQDSDIKIESEEDVECTGLVAATRRSVEAVAIADARSKVDALAAAAHMSIGGLVSADVSSEEGSWDDNCVRTVTATASLTVK